MKTLAQGVSRGDPFSYSGLIWRIAALLLIATLIRTSSFSNRLRGAHTFRQTQTASMIRCFSEGRSTFLHPTSDVGMPSDPTAIEPPLYQWIVGNFCRWFGYSELAARIFSLACGLWTGMALLLLVNEVTKSRTASWLCAAFYFGAVLPAFFHAIPLPDNLLLALVATAIWLFAKASRGIGKRSCFWAIGLSALAIGLKPPLCVGLVFAAFFILRNRAKAAQAAAVVIVVIILGGIITVGWGLWAKAISKGTYFEFVFTPRFALNWNFGWEKLAVLRFYWLEPLRCIQQTCWLAIPLISIACIKKHSLRPIVLGWLAGEFAAFFIFPNLNYFHNYYQLRISLFSAAAGAIGWFALTQTEPRSELQRILIDKRAVTVMGFSAVLLPLLLLSRHQRDDVFLEYEAAQELKQLAPVPVAAAIDRFYWDFSFPYFSDRQIFLIFQHKNGSVNIDNFDAFEKLHLNDLYIVGDPWSAEGRMGYVDNSFAAKVLGYVEQNYTLVYEGKALRCYTRRKLADRRDRFKPNSGPDDDQSTFSNVGADYAK
jgi:hypothetical protein